MSKHINDKDPGGEFDRVNADGHKGGAVKHPTLPANVPVVTEKSLEASRSGDKGRRPLNWKDQNEQPVGTNVPAKK